jgi:hypothetical protein
VVAQEGNKIYRVFSDSGRNHPQESLHSDE